MEQALPGAIADDGGLLVFMLEPAAQEWADPDYLGIVERDRFGCRGVRFAIEIQARFGGIWMPPCP